MEYELLRSVVFSITQRALAGVAAVLIAGGWISSDQATSLVLVVAGSLATLLIYLHSYLKNKAHLALENKQIQVALQSSALTPVELVKSVAKSELNSSKEPTKL